LPVTVTQLEPPLTYVKRLGTSALPAAPNALWQPLQTRANDAGRAAAVLVVQGADEIASVPLDEPAVPDSAAVVPLAEVVVAPEVAVVLPVPALAVVPDAAAVEPEATSWLPGGPEDPAGPDEPQPAARSAAMSNPGALAKRSVREEVDKSTTVVIDTKCLIKKSVIRKCCTQPLRFVGFSIEPNTVIVDCNSYSGRTP
jgi:hypothetical protein